MTADLWSEDARGIWQSQESVVTRMSADDMRARADAMEPGVRGNELDRVRLRGRASCSSLSRCW